MIKNDENNKQQILITQKDRNLLVDWDSMSSDESSQSQEVCRSTESLSPDKSSLSQEVFHLIMELMSSEKSS